MIPAVRLGAGRYRMGREQLLCSPAAMSLLPGSQHLELLVQANLRDPERWGEPPHHDPRWFEDDPRGIALRTLDAAFQRRLHLERMARNLTPEQRDALWQDTSEQAAALRRVMRGVRYT